MRYFLIADEQGTPLYYDHPEGRLLSLILVNTHLLVKTNFGQTFSSMRCGNVLFVYAHFSQLTFTVVSDRGESEAYLRTQLQQIFEHLVMVFGEAVVLDGKYSFYSRHKKKIQYIIDTMCDLSEKHQGMLIQATERLLVDESTREQCLKGLEKAVENEPLVTHGMIFVGTKRLVSYTKNGAGADIDRTDALLLVNQFRATFHPTVREVYETALPVADYSTYESESLDDNLAPLPENDGFVSASEELEEIEKEEFELAVVTMLLNPNLAAAMYQRLQILEEGDNEVRLYSMFKGEEHLRNPFSPHMRGDKDLARELDPETSKMIGDFFDALDQNKFRLGNSGDHVLLLNEMLSVISYLPGVINSDYHENTALAISAFQANNSIEKTGVPNFFTIKLLLGQVLKYYAKKRRLEMKRRRKQRRKERKNTSKDGDSNSVAQEGDSESPGEKKSGEDDESTTSGGDGLSVKKEDDDDENEGEAGEESITVRRIEKGEPQTSDEAVTVTQLSPNRPPQRFFKEGSNAQTYHLIDSSPVTTSSSSEEEVRKPDNKKTPKKVEKPKKIPTNTRQIQGEAAHRLGKYSSGSSSLSSSPEVRSYLSAVSSSGSSSPRSPRSPTPAIAIPVQPHSPHFQSPRQAVDPNILADGLGPQTPTTGVGEVTSPDRQQTHSGTRGNKNLARNLYGEDAETEGAVEATTTGQAATPVTVRRRTLTEDATGLQRPVIATGSAPEGAAARPNDNSNLNNNTQPIITREQRAETAESSSLFLSDDEEDEEEEDEEELTAWGKDHQRLPDLQNFDPTSKTSYQLLYLRLPKYAWRWVYFAELENTTTLVLVCSAHAVTGAKGHTIEQQKLDAIRDAVRKILKPYAKYLITKELTHIPILNYLYQFPGLVHFIFVDRTHNKVIAPPLTSLHGMDYFAAITDNGNTTIKSQEEKQVLLSESVKLHRLLKERVWDMCYQVQQKLSEGYFYVLNKSGAFQYSYRFWIEDSEHDEVPFTLDNIVIPTQIGQNYQFYKELVEKSFPSRNGLRCYELYTLYLGVLSVKSVINHDKNLLNMLQK